MARSFDEFQPSGSGCPRCGGPEKAGAVTIRLLEFQDGTSSRFDQKASRQVSMCEDCTVEVYEELVGILNKESKGGTRRPRSESQEPPRRRRRTTARR